MTLDELLAQIAEYVTDDDEKRTKAGEVARALHRSAATQPIAQILVGRGVTRTAGQQQAKVAELESTITSLKADLAERDQELQELKAQAPDWKRRLDEQEAKHQKKVGELQTALDGEKKGRREDRLSAHRAALRTKLQPGIAIDADYVEVLVNKLGDRLRLAPDDGRLEVLEIGSDTPYDVADGQDPLDALVADALRSVPPKWKLLGEPKPGGGVQGERVGETKPKTFEQLKEAQRRSGLYAF